MSFHAFLASTTAARKGKERRRASDLPRREMFIREEELRLTLLVQGRTVTQSERTPPVSDRFWLTGATLLIVGGAIKLVGLGVSSASTALPMIGYVAGLAAALPVAQECFALGLFALSLGLTGLSRAATVIASLTASAVLALAVLQVLSRSTIGLAPLLVLNALQSLALIVASGLILLDRGQRRGDREAVTLLAACFTVSFVAIYAHLSDSLIVTILPWVSCVVAGGLLAATQRYSRASGEVA